MFENNVEKLCLELESPCQGSTIDWQDFCSKSVGRVRNETNQLNSMETFFSSRINVFDFDTRKLSKITKVKKEFPNTKQLNSFCCGITKVLSRKFQKTNIPFF